MDYFSPGPRELARKLNRQTARRRLAAINRALAAAETELGLLGWQQADYDADTQRQVREIQSVEKEQTRLTNEAASVATQLRELQSERLTAQRQSDERLRQMDAERRRLREPYDLLERQIAERRKTEPNFVLRIPDLDRELREKQKLYAELIQVSPQTAKVRQELAWLRERIVAIPNEKSDLRTQHLRTVSDIRALEELLEREAPPVAKIEEEIRLHKEEWVARDAAFTERVKSLEAARHTLELQIEKLESAKANPYQRIGQVLADNNLAPLNQPRALEKVKRLRFDAGERLQVILESEARSAAENSLAVKMSALLWAAIVLALLIFSLVALR